MRSKTNARAVKNDFSILEYLREIGVSKESVLLASLFVRNYF